MDPSLWDNVLIPEHHLFGISCRRKIHVRDRQTVFFTAVDPMDEKWVDQEGEHEVSEPRYASYMHVWQVAQDAVYWVDIGRAQRMELQFYQGRSNANILHDTLLRYALEEWYRGKIMKSCIQGFFKSPRLAHTITLKSNWRTNLGHNAEAPVSGSQFASTEKLVTLKSRTVLDQRKEREVKNEDEEYDQASTEKPVTLKKRTSLDR